MTLRLWPGGGQLALRAALAHLVERWPEYDEDPLGGGGGRGNSAATGWCHTGTLGLHLMTLASSSPAPTAGLGLKERKEELEKQRSTGSRTVEGRGSGNGGQAGWAQPSLSSHHYMDLENGTSLCHMQQAPPCLPQGRWVTGDT